MGSANTGPDFDVLVVGAGLSGINAAYRISHELPASTTYAVLESRAAIGGTWDFFRYPGIRSDSDIASFCFPWAPWESSSYLAQGRDIQQYMDKAAADAGITPHIRFHHTVQAADWNTASSTWRVTVDTPQGPSTLTSRFIVIGSGYYNYQTPLATTIPGIEAFAGKVVHPQFWPKDLAYKNKSIVIIGSGATAVTLLPSLANSGAGHVTMLQRSPSYLFPLPTVDRASVFFNRILPALWAANILRLYNTARTYLLFWFCQAFPAKAISFLRKTTESLLPEGVAYDPHFKPKYNPWDQRLCITPGGDFFKTLRSGAGSVVTDTIEQVTSKSIRLTSGQVLHPDIIVTATGLKICFAGNIRLSIDGGETIHPGDKFVWKAAMIEDIPNLFYMLGYTNASWTLGADVTAALVVRMINKLNKEGKRYAVPRMSAEERKRTKPEPLFDLSSTYLKNASEDLPKGGKGQWGPRTHWFRDMWRAKWGDVNTGLEVR